MYVYRLLLNFDFLVPVVFTTKKIVIVTRAYVYVHNYTLLGRDLLKFVTSLHRHGYAQCLYYEI